METQDLSREITELHADICSALADPRRIMLIYAMAEKSRNVSELAEEVGISQPAASRHLKILKERGLATPVRNGASVEYQLTDHRLVDALDTLRSVLRGRINHRANLIANQALGE